MASEDSGKNPGDVSPENVAPGLPGPRVTTPEVGDTSGANLSAGFGYKMGIHDVTEESIGADTMGPGQVHQQMPKDKAGRGTKFG